jgi:bifunctional non-homologous end joining protein LigD
VAPGAKKRLERYEGKRDFARTPEPSPAKTSSSRKARARRSSSAPRFVIHEHSARRLHWDLRLEHDGVLDSWAIPKGLPAAPRENHLAVHTEDHPLEYLDFHGEIPAGEYGAGTMTIWDSGTYEELKWDPRKVEVALHGRRVDARYALFPIEAGANAKDWMIHRMDPAADPQAGPMPEHVVPMLARAGTLPREDGRWAYEIKWDGVRAIAYSQPGALRLESRNLIDVTDRYPELARLNRALSSHGAVLDGEIVAFADGRPSFEALQQRMGLTSRAQAARRAKDAPVTYVIFDLLWLDGHSLTELPYSERRERLDALRLHGPSWQTPENVVGHGKELARASAERHLEGIIAKRLTSTYQPGARSSAWIKIKTTASQELVIGGWTPGKGSRSGGIGALLVGVHDPDGSLRYVGRVGSGLSEREIARLEPILAAHELSRSPFASGPRPPRGARFTEPRLVAEVEFSEWTSAGSLRAPRFKGLRDDKPAAEVVREQPLVDAAAPARGSRAAAPTPASRWRSARSRAAVARRPSTATRSRSRTSTRSCTPRAAPASAR